MESVAGTSASKSNPWVMVLDELACVVIGLIAGERGVLMIGLMDGPG